MITRIHPEIVETPEYDPFEDEKIIDLGPHDRMTVKQALITTYQANLKNVVTIGENEFGGATCTYSKMPPERILFMLEKMKSIIMEESGEYPNPEDAG